MKAIPSHIRICAVFLSALIFSVPTSSQGGWLIPHFFTGQKLLNACEAEVGTVKAAMEIGICSGYIAGVVDASVGLDVHASLSDGTHTLPLCLPSSISNMGIIQDIVVKFMKEHPERLGSPAIYLVRNALQSFACKTGWPDGISPPDLKK